MREPAPLGLLGGEVPRDSAIDVRLRLGRGPRGASWPLLDGDRLAVHAREGGGLRMVGAVAGKAEQQRGQNDWSESHGDGRIPQSRITSVARW